METSTKAGSSGKWSGKLLNYDMKVIATVYSGNPPALDIPKELRIANFRYRGDVAQLRSGGQWPSFSLLPARNKRDQAEWAKFLSYLRSSGKVGMINIVGAELFVLPPETVPNQYLPVEVVYFVNEAAFSPPKLLEPVPIRTVSGVRSNADAGNARAAAAQMHPEYLTTLSQTHASWIFGGVAELIDNARDAKSRRLDIYVTKGKLKMSKAEIPMLCFLDDGVGMSHEQIVQMVSFGHKKPEEDDAGQIGRFGVGFKTGAMRLGKDAIVFSQKGGTRSIALLSTSYNKGREVLEVPVVTYVYSPGRMEYDTQAQSKQLAKVNEKAITSFSPFDKYGIGSEFNKLGGRSGTLIYVYNLETRGSSFSLDWENGGKDIVIASKRVRTRPGQTSQEVPLDYSLRAYVEVMFLEPRMIICIQGKQVKTRPLAKSLSKTRTYTGFFSGKSVELTVGRNEAEAALGNCGIFMYWHGRLIEAYKRVGNMVHSADWGRGVIGVVETTELMELGGGRVGVLNNKQGFEDSEHYEALEKWLGKQADSYWERNVENLYTEDSEGFPPDRDWVQCNKCLKWRVLPSGSNTSDLPDEWFCYMPPFNGTCQEEEEEAEPGVVTIGVKRVASGEANAQASREQQQHEQQIIKRRRRPSKVS